MVISLIVVVPGVFLLLVVAFAGLLGQHGRQSDTLLIGPRNAEFGEASRLVRTEATREQARADLAAFTSRKTDRGLVLLLDSAVEQPDRHAA